MRRFGLTDATWRPLFHLGRFGDGMRQTDLAAALEIEGPSLVRLLDALERAGLVERRGDLDDRRSKTLRLTPSGRETYELVAAEHERVSATLLKGVKPSDLAACRRAFTLIEHSLIEEAGRRNGPDAKPDEAGT